MRRDVSPDEQAKIIARMTTYCETVLEMPNPAFGNKPACPFSRRERDNDHIQYEFFAILPEGPSADVVQAVKDFSDARRFKTLLIVDPELAVTLEQAVEFGLALSKQCANERIVAISVHPDDTFAVDGYRTREKIPHVTMLCQAADYLRQAKDQLEGTGYYSKWTEASLNYNFEQIGQFLDEE
jgi:hypothetical protein